LQVSARVLSPIESYFFSVGGVAYHSINEVTLRRARFVLGWVTACGHVNHLGM